MTRLAGRLWIIGTLMVLFNVTTARGAVYWLPDYIGDNAARSNDGGGQEFGSDCSHYTGMTSSCASPKIHDGYKTVASKLKCYKNCRCDSSYAKVCSGNYQGGETACGGKNKTCVCKPAFNKTAEDCKASAGYQLGSNVCDGRSDRCEALPCASGGYSDTAQTDRKCSGVSYGGRTCYHCTQPACSEGGYQASVPANNKCTAVSYYGRTCQSNCYQPACSEGGYQASVPANNKCTAVSYFGRTCQTACYQPACSEGGYQTSVPTNNKCTAVTYYGRTCQSSCYQPACSAGGYQASVPAGYACTAVNYYGRTCQKDCKQLCANTCSLSTCPEGGSCTKENCSGKYCLKSCIYGYKMCNGTCISDNLCCNNTCTNNLTCEENKCVINCTPYMTYTVTTSQDIPTSYPSKTCRDIRVNGPGDVVNVPNNRVYTSLEFLVVKDFQDPGYNFGLPIKYGSDTVNIYGDFTTGSLTVYGYNERSGITLSKNVTFIFHGKVTVTGTYSHLKKLTVKQTGVYHNLNVKFLGGITGSYKCVAGKMYRTNANAEVIYECPNGTKPLEDW